MFILIMFEHSVLSSFDHPLLIWTHMVAEEDSSPSQKRLQDYTSSSMTENTEDMSLLFWCFFVFFPIEIINDKKNHTISTISKQANNQMKIASLNARWLIMDKFSEMSPLRLQKCWWHWCLLFEVPLKNIPVIWRCHQGFKFITMLNTYSFPVDKGCNRVNMTVHK